MRRLAASAALLVAAPFALAACTAETAESETADATAAAPREQEAVELLQVTSPHEATGGTLLEGPTFGEDGLLYVVDVMAPAGEPKVLRVDVADKSAEAVFSDETSAFTSAQFSPADGRLYLTDIASGSITSMTADGADVQSVFAGEVDGSAMLPDDIAFDPDGNMFVSDTNGMRGPGWETPGRVVRVGLDGAASVLAADLPSPNGIVFDEDDAGLYIAQYNANRIDYYGLDETGSAVVTAHPAVHVDGMRARVDSTAVDADGNLYQAFHGRPAIAVFSPTGEQLQTISVAGDGLDSATNIAIAPGTSDGYVTVSGPAGGYIYSFDALAEGTRQSNGG